MTQEQLKQEFLNYAINNLNNKTILEAIKELLSGIENDLIIDGYKRESNRLVTAELIINEVLESE